MADDKRHPTTVEFAQKLQSKDLQDALGKVDLFVSRHESYVNSLISAIQNDLLAEWQRCRTQRQSFDEDKVIAIFATANGTDDNPAYNGTRVGREELLKLAQSIQSDVLRIIEEEVLVTRMDSAGKWRDLRFRIGNTVAIGLIVMAFYLGAFALGKYSETFRGFQPPFGRWVVNPVTLPKPSTAIRMGEIKQKQSEPVPDPEKSTVETEQNHPEPAPRPEKSSVETEQKVRLNEPESSAQNSPVPLDKHQ